jgi:hypothetical protein
MIESVKELDLEFEEEDKKLTIEEFLKLVESKLDAKLTEKLGISLTEIKQSISDSLLITADQQALDILNVAPYDDYGDFLEDAPSIAKFLKTDVTKLENWKFKSLSEDPKDKSHLKVKFYSKAVDDGKTFSGIVLISKSGKIKHAFTQHEG